MTANMPRFWTPVPSPIAGWSLASPNLYLQSSYKIPILFQNHNKT